MNKRCEQMCSTGENWHGYLDRVHKNTVYAGTVVDFNRKLQHPPRVAFRFQGAADRRTENTRRVCSNERNREWADARDARQGRPQRRGRAGGHGPGGLALGEKEIGTNRGKSEIRVILILEKKTPFRPRASRGPRTVLERARARA